jgi:hypothetical protein
MCAKSFKKVDYIDCKIIVFEVEHFLHLTKQGQQSLNPLEA